MGSPGPGDLPTRLRRPPVRAATANHLDRVRLVAAHRPIMIDRHEGHRPSGARARTLTSRLGVVCVEDGVLACGGRCEVTEDGTARRPSSALRRVLVPLALAQFICSFAGTNMNVMINDMSEDLDTS